MCKYKDNTSIILKVSCNLSSVSLSLFFYLYTFLSLFISLSICLTYLYHSLSMPLSFSLYTSYTSSYKVINLSKISLMTQMIFSDNVLYKYNIKTSSSQCVYYKHKLYKNWTGERSISSLSHHLRQKLFWKPSFGGTSLPNFIMNLRSLQSYSVYINESHSYMLKI